MAGKQTRNGSQTSDHSSTTLSNSLQRLSSGFHSHIGRPITNRSDMWECSTLRMTPVPAGQILLERISRGLASGHDSQQVHFFYAGKLPVDLVDLETSSFQRRWESGDILTIRAIHIVQGSHLVPCETSIGIITIQIEKRRWKWAMGQKKWMFIRSTK